ncbi:hypothetical protein D9M71_639160 [compost metagenome]
MALIAQPFRHPDLGIDYLRRGVPENLRPILGKVEIRRSLRTRDHREAKAAFAIAFADSERLFLDPALLRRQPARGQSPRGPVLGYPQGRIRPLQLREEPEREIPVED